MSDVCGRRRLAKLAFVTGASGNLRGFLEEPVHTNYNYRLTDPFAFHAAFLEERLRMQSLSSTPGSQPDPQGSPAVQKGEPGEPSEKPDEVQEEAEAVKAFEALSGEIEKFLPVDEGEKNELLEKLRAKLLKNAGQMQEFTDKLKKITSAQQKRIKKIVEAARVTDAESSHDPAEAKAKALIQQLKDFKEFQAGISDDGNYEFYGHQDKAGSGIFVFQVERSKVESLDKSLGQEVTDTTSPDAQFMHLVRADAVFHAVKMSFNNGVITMTNDVEALKKKTELKPSEEFENLYAPSVAISKGIAIRLPGDDETIVAVIRGSDGQNSFASGIREPVTPEQKKVIALATAEKIPGFTPLVDASAGGLSNKAGTGSQELAKAFFESAMENGISLAVNLQESGWKIKINPADEKVFAIDESKFGTDEAQTIQTINDEENIGMFEDFAMKFLSGSEQDIFYIEELDNGQVSKKLEEVKQNLLKNTFFNGKKDGSRDVVAWLRTLPSDDLQGDNLKKLVKFVTKTIESEAASTEKPAIVGQTSSSVDK